MQIKLAVFDISGTTVNDSNAVSIALKEAFEEFGVQLSEADVYPLMGYKKTSAIEILFNRAGHAYDHQAIENVHALFEKNMIDFYKKSPHVVPMSSAVDTLRYLRSDNVVVALNTGFPRSIAEVIVDRLQWMQDGTIDDFIASDEVEDGRPSPFMIRQLMQRHSISNGEEVMKVGDTEVDVREGRSAGCGSVIAVTTGAFSRKELEPYGPDFIIDDLSELIARMYNLA